jgi:hypothetical protein
MISTVSFYPNPVSYVCGDKRILYCDRVIAYVLFPKKMSGFVR